MKNRLLTYLFAIIVFSHSCDTKTIYEIEEEESLWTYAGTDITNIEEFSIQLNAMPLRDGESGKWKIISGLIDDKVSFNDENDPKTIFKGLPDETYKLCWNVSTGTQSTSDTISLTFSPINIEIKNLSANYHTTLITLQGTLLDKGHWEIEGEYHNPELVDFNSPFIKIHGKENTTIKAKWTTFYGSKSASKTFEIQTKEYSEFEALEDLQIDIVKYPNEYKLDEEGHVVHLNLHASGTSSRFERIDLHPRLQALKHVKRLIISGDLLSNLPSSIPDIMRELTYLDCTNNRIVSLPNNIGNLTQLDTLLLSGQDGYYSYKNIAKLPDSFVKLENLVFLDMAGLDCEELPENFGRLSNLKHLDLCYNKIKSLPDNFGNLKNLEYLDLFMECDIPESICKLDKLTFCRLHVNNDGKSTLIPENIGNLRLLKSLELMGNFSNLPESIGNLTQLEKFEIVQNVSGSQGPSLSFETIPESIGNLVKLNILRITGGKFESLPESFGNLKCLNTLIIKESELKYLPQSFGNLPLIHLDFSHANIEYLPESITNIKDLRYLGLNYNEIKELPENIGNLTNLNTIFLVGNNLENLPESIKNLSECLKYLYLGYNKITPDKLDTIKTWLPSTTVNP